jgi:hypothetical protein
LTSVAVPTILAVWCDDAAVLWPSTNMEDIRTIATAPKLRKELFNITSPMCIIAIPMNGKNAT